MGSAGRFRSPCRPSTLLKQSIMAKAAFTLCQGPVCFTRHELPGSVPMAHTAASVYEQAPFVSGGVVCIVWGASGHNAGPPRTAGRPCGSDCNHHALQTCMCWLSSCTRLLHSTAAFAELHLCLLCLTCCAVVSRMCIGLLVVYASPATLVGGDRRTVAAVMCTSLQPCQGLLHPTTWPQRTRCQD